MYLGLQCSKIPECIFCHLLCHQCNQESTRTNHDEIPEGFYFKRACSRLLGHDPVYRLTSLYSICCGGSKKCRCSTRGDPEDHVHQQEDVRYKSHRSFETHRRVIRSPKQGFSMAPQNDYSPSKN